jgi:DNA-binding response OmpR family regulator
MSNDFAQFQDAFFEEAGATGWIVKPFNPELMLKVIAKLLPS